MPAGNRPDASDSCPYGKYRASAAWRCGLWPEEMPGEKPAGTDAACRILGFVHPSTGAYVQFDAPLPEYFEELLKKIEKADRKLGKKETDMSEMCTFDSFF